MPRKQLALAPGELAALEARSHHDLQDDDAEAAEAKLVMVPDGFLGEGGGPQGQGLSAQTALRGGWIHPACRAPLPPPVVRAAIVRFLLFAHAAKVGILRMLVYAWVLFLWSHSLHAWCIIDSA